MLPGIVELAYPEEEQHSSVDEDPAVRREE